MIPPVALSTVALGAYNVLCLARRPLDLIELAAGCGRFGATGVDATTLEAALVELVRRGRVAIATPSGVVMYAAVDQLFRTVIGRDQRDAKIGDDGTVSGGWERWVVRDFDRGRALLDEELKR